MRTEIVVFLGPTLSAAEARKQLDAIYLPPAGQGDVVRAVLEHAPSVIAIIDGEFAQRPAVRHKEILWAMAKGIRVFGASSMGAVRAAELCDYGMAGHGFVFRWYRRTRLADDADVAVAMAPPELGSRALTDALIDIRLTLKQSERLGIITRELRALLEETARSLHFSERTYHNIFSRSENNKNTIEIDKLRNHLESSSVQQKKSDAIELLKAVSRMASLPRDPNKDETFEMTEAFAFDLQDSDLLDQISRAD
ncbi:MULTISPECIES: TfuA-like protein [unclassified Ensifer]|uniref:TfuA-like protein n=1 Tax=unclassified Ensifer TaxID=2633371 RepID=UPI0008136E87|nr:MULTISPECIES: TfuA-like protein [unclassified Ensifer]OCP04852.1 hypothetical protein BC362_13855 [Ensifer sp. LC14]OCP08773.1 hypothetical protein BBX50_19545 [Ensifer sp. LC11]OCP09991.1 hypothetical protein BC374_19340 [Ensifer sp. LC13]OCP33047.1 hypothetical protein BC364_18185 [Ensifer sp. LC499]